MTRPLQALLGLALVATLFSCGKGAEPPSPPADRRTDALFGLSCRDLILEASMEYKPPRWTDGVADFAPPIRVGMPRLIPVIQGNAGNGPLKITRELGGKQVVCLY